MSPTLSVIICTHNPRIDYLTRVLTALSQQTLSLAQWELLIIDNGSSVPLNTRLDLSWHPHARIVREDQLGLTTARLRGFRESTGELMVYVDDDNVLAADYLAHVVQLFDQFDALGALGGKSMPEFEVEPAPWIDEFYTVLALRDFGEQPLIREGDLGGVTRHRYPEFAPAGIGLALRRRAFRAYVERVSSSPQRLALGRTGKQLTSGEDNDIILTLMNAGWGVGYFPQLQLTHLIAASRINWRYLARLNHAASRSWVQVLNVHGICPWQKIPSWTVLPRKLKALMRHQPWRGHSAYVRWAGVCGLLDGQAILD